MNNRILALWQYTRINDPRLVLRDDFILIRANPNLPPAKIGYYNPYGWLAYWLDGLLFRKKFDIHPGEEYPDGGCNVESFINDRFVELESLGPLTILEPGSCTSLTETWELFDTLNVPFIPDEIREVINKTTRERFSGNRRGDGVNAACWAAEARPTPPYLSLYHGNSQRPKVDYDAINPSSITGYCVNI